MADEPVVVSKRRGRGAEATARAEALERLKAVKRGGRRSEAGGGYVIKVDQPIYDTVPEEEYEELVKKRREDTKGFIVDDEGLGYGDEAEEDDWNRGSYSDYSSDEEGEPGRKKKKTKENDKEVDRKRKPNPALTAAAAMMGKQRISSMFTSTVFNNKDASSKVKGAECDSILNDIIAEFAPDEADIEKRKKLIGGHSLRTNSECVPVKVYKEAPATEFMLPKKEIAVTEKEAAGNFPIDTVNLEPETDTQCRNGAEMELSVEEIKGKLEVKDELVEVKVEEKKVLNAKIVNDTKNSAPCATSEWQAVRNLGRDNNEIKECAKIEINGDELSDLKENAEGLLPFFIIDAHEEVFGANAGTIYLFGKVLVKSAYQSCCVVVKNMQRCVYAVPKWPDSTTEEIFKLENDVEEKKISNTDFRKKLQELAYDVKNEIATKLVAHNLSKFTMTPVKRSYAFERNDIPHGENYVIKITYPYKNSPIPADLKGDKFITVLGTHSSPLEHFLVKRKVKGPSWLSVTNYASCLQSQRVSWCKFEITVNSPKDISVLSSKSSMEIPPVVVTAINVKTVMNEKQNTNEIVSASIICCHKAKIDGPMLASEWKKPGMLSSFSVVRKLDGIFPVGFNKDVTERNGKAGTNVLAVESSERALINRLIIELFVMDSDILVGHNISGFDLDVLLNRAQVCRVPSSAWSKLGRLKRSEMPKIRKMSSVFGSGASPGIMSCIAGRLLCDTFLCSRDLLKEVSYSLTNLAKNRLNKERKEISPQDISNMFRTSSSLMDLIEYGETDGWLSLELMFHMSVLPLTRQLTNISGNLWGKTLQGARALRVEFLLLHAFYAKKYMLPDKIQNNTKDSKQKKRTNDGNAEVNDEVTREENAQEGNTKSKKGPAYAGGLVLDPKKGLYDKFVLLLDFNSLYPSIIREYNICFTTVEKPEDGTIPHLPSTEAAGILPELLKNLVERRRMVKTWMKTASGLKLQQLDIQQQALKLTANSIYGCLGFSNSRFYAKPLAELITLQGREILQSTVDLVQNNLNLEVIYGDTDSIMIYSGVDDISKAKLIAGKVIREVNKKYKCLEIDLDGLYGRMLLLKKKKYAAVKVDMKDGKPCEVIERKGLDIVRRDWSLIAKEIGDYCLTKILSGGSCEEVVESIHSSLTKLKDDMRSGEIALDKYIITKTLTKPPESYSDAKNQPHVQVALRLKQTGYTSGFSPGDTVPYIISSDQSEGLAQRARHPDEFLQRDANLQVDIDYYLSQQIHPVVSRLCASIQGTSPERIAHCLGLDSSKFQIRPNPTSFEDRSSPLLFASDDSQRYSNCEPMVICCPTCSNSFECPPIFSSVCGEEAENSFWVKMTCPKCEAGAISPATLSNQVKRQADAFVAKYYKGWLMCDDETCKLTTRCVNLRVVGDCQRGTTCPNYPRCYGHLVRKYTEADLYKQLSFFCHVLDTFRCLDKLDKNVRISCERQLAQVRPFADVALSVVRQIKDRCGYGWVQLDSLCVSV